MIHKFSTYGRPHRLASRLVFYVSCSIASQSVQYITFECHGCRTSFNITFECHGIHIVQPSTAASAFGKVATADSPEVNGPKPPMSTTYYVDYRHLHTFECHSCCTSAQSLYGIRICINAQTHLTQMHQK